MSRSKNKSDKREKKKENYRQCLCLRHLLCAWSACSDLPSWHEHMHHCHRAASKDHHHGWCNQCRSLWKACSWTPHWWHMAPLQWFHPPISPHSPLLPCEAEEEEAKASPPDFISKVSAHQRAKSAGTKPNSPNSQSRIPVTPILRTELSKNSWNPNSQNPSFFLFVYLSCMDITVGPLLVWISSSLTTPTTSSSPSARACRNALACP